MKALRVHDYGGPEKLQLADVPVPEPREGEVRVQVAAAGVNYADLLMIAGEYQLRPEPPFSPGFEVAGTIDAVGDGVDGWSVGVDVVATPWHGGYAEQVVLPATAVFPRPGGVGPVAAAAGTVTFGTAYHALTDRAGLRPGEVLLVTGGTGGVGSAAVQVGRSLGATVIAAVGSEEKVAIARDLGADDVVVYTGGSGLREQIEAAAGGRGLDVVFDVVGGDVFDQCVRAVAPGGRILVVGFTAGRIPRLPTNLVLLKESSVVGVFWGAFREREPDRAARQLEQIWAWIGDGHVSAPPITTYPLDSAVSALRALAQRRVAGKIVLVTSAAADAEGAA